MVLTPLVFAILRTSSIPVLYRNGIRKKISSFSRMLLISAIVL